MARVLQQYSLKKLRPPASKDIDDDIRWICNCLGFVSSRDQDMTAYKILKALVKSNKKKKGMTSEELTKIVEPTIGSVIYHLNKLIKAGLVVKHGSVYELKMNSLYETIEELRREINHILDDTSSIARDVDDKIGLEYRQ